MPWLLLLLAFTGVRIYDFGMFGRSSCGEALHVHAQVLNKDSVVKIAYTDAQKFKMGNEDLKRFRRNKYNANSDLFKPATAAVSDSALLADSAYVTAYRIAAYDRTVKRRTTGHKLLVGGGIYVAATVLAAFITLLVLFGHAKM